MKAPPAPNIQYQQYKSVQKHENTVIAHIICEAFTLSAETKANKKISAFYGGLNERFIKWTDTYFKNYAESLYVADTDRRKRYRYVPLEIKYVSKAQQGENYTLDILITVTLSRGKNVLSEKQIKHSWSLKNGNRVLKKLNPRSKSLK